MSKHSSLSQRGQTAQHTQLRIDFEVFFEAMENLYHPVDNPDGAIPLNIAENRLSWHLLRDKMQHISCEQSIPDWVPSYTSCPGRPRVQGSHGGLHEPLSDPLPD
jgi:hypothetical protein